MPTPLHTSTLNSSLALNTNVKYVGIWENQLSLYVLLSLNGVKHQNRVAVRLALLCFRKCYNWFKATWVRDLSGRVGKLWG